MREIKFRTFVKESKKMIYGRSAMAVKMFTPNYSYLNNEVEVMQYTGLQDKNGKDIYEGDVLKVPDLYETPENTYPTYHYEKVIYANHGFGTDNAMFYEDGDYISEECEVVGNIYENKDLL